MRSFTVNLVLNSLVSDKSISGGDRISLELCRGWQKQGCVLRVYACKDGYELCKRERLEAEYHIISDFSLQKWGLLIGYSLRILKSLFFVSRVENNGVIFSSSDFLTDTIAAYKIKRKNKGLKWISGLYLIAPNPFSRNASFGIRPLIYFLTQKLSISFMRKYADTVFVLNQRDKRYLAGRGIPEEKIKVVSGGVNLAFISGVSASGEIRYEGCFIGRFHRQKGIFDLIRIWEIICRDKPQARLALIGWGDKHWNEILRREIAMRRLEKKISLLGVLDGRDKFEVLKSSRVFLFPSNYESWGVVALEAMACGLPVVAYNLDIYADTFPLGMLRVKSGDMEDFAKSVVKLLDDPGFYQKMKDEALKISYHYDWGVVADNALRSIANLFAEPLAS